MTPDEQMAQVQAMTNRWLTILEKEINRQIERKGKDKNVVLSACMSAASRLAVMTVLQYSPENHGQMIQHFGDVLLAIYKEEMAKRGPQIIVPGRTLQ